MAKKQLCANIVWRIENFTYCWQERDERLVSEKFIIETLENAAFHILLYPRWSSDSDDLGLYLKRAENDGGRESIEISYELFVLQKNDVPYKTKGVIDKAFKCSNSWGFPSVLKQTDLCNFSDKLQPGNVFSVGCKIWIMSETRLDPPKICLRTLIPVTKCSFCWKVDTAIVSTYDHTRTILFEKLFGSQNYFEVTLSYLTENVDEVFVKITVSGDMKEKCSFKCDIQNDRSKDSFLIKTSRIRGLHYEELCSPLITMHQINADPQKYLIGTTLVLNCEFSLISHNVKNSENVMVCDSEHPSIWYQRIDGKYENAYLAERNFNEPVPCNCPLKQDIRKLYRNEVKSDLTLQVGSEMFNVHSTILSARSEVFFRMFENDMKEKQNKILKIEDLDSKSVKKMLNYVYIDDPGELTVDTAIKLYYAGDKYEIVGLKQKSSDYLMQNINNFNLYEILGLAYRHNDEELKNSAISFLFQHEKDIVLTDEYKALCENNHTLGLEIMQELSKRRFKRFKPNVSE